MSDWEKINITKAQAELYRSEVELKQHNNFITINDIDTDEILFDWRCSEIKRFVERKQDKGTQWAVFICSFWVRHPLSMGWACECKKEFKTLWILFKDRLKEMWYKVFYDDDITEEMRLEYLQKYVKWV